MKRFHKPVRLLLKDAQTGNAQAQFELGIHPVLADEDRFYWLIKAKQQEHQEAIMVLEKMDQERQLNRLYEAAANGNVEAQFMLGTHPLLDAAQHYSWLGHAVNNGHNEAKKELQRMDLLLVYEGNKALVTAEVPPPDDILH
jgi:hypothetical protein